MSVDRRSVNVLLAALDIEQRDLAELMGYKPTYVANVLNGHTVVSRPFGDAFGVALAELLLGMVASRDMYPAAPLVELIHKRATEAPSREQFYDDLGVDRHALDHRDVLAGSLVDRVCCALGVHTTAVYGPNGEVEEER
jgi:transcriptional regulator with XRE-family HTH domain